MLQERFTLLHRATTEPSGPVSWYMVAVEGTLYCIALNTGIPYIRPAMAFSENQFLSRFLGASVYIAIGSVCVRTLADFIAYWRVVRPEFSHGSVEWKLMLGSVCLGIAASVPGACVTLKYNPQWVLPLSLFYDITTCVVSYNTFFRQLYHDRWLYHGEQSLRKKRDAFFTQLQLGECTANADSLSSIFQQVRVTANPKILNRLQHPWVYQRGLMLSQMFFGIGLPLSWEIVCLQLVYHDMKSVLGAGDALAGILACITTFPAFFLEYQFAKAMVSALYLFTMDAFYSIQTQHLLMKNHPRKTLIGMGLATVLMGGSFTSRAQVITDLLDATPQREALLIAVCVGTVIFKLSAALHNVLAIGLALCIRYDNDPSFKMHHLLQQFQMLIRTTTPADMLAFYSATLADDEHDAQHPEREELLTPSQENDGADSPRWYEFFKRRSSQPLPSNRQAVDAIESGTRIEMH